MAFLLKKVIKPWNAAKESLSQQDNTEKPVSPPPPDLSHLTPDEISVIHDVIRRQEEFDRQEANRVKKLREELDSLQQQLTENTFADAQNRKVVDLRLCRLCFRTKFADGVGRVCHDCQQRVCQGCGAFSKPRWNARKNKTVRGRWRCKLCMARREVLCSTGGWYHGTPDPADELKKKLSVTVDTDQEGDPEPGSTTVGFKSRAMMRGNNDHDPSGNRTDSELVGISSEFQSPRKLAMKIFTRRRSLPPDSPEGREESNEVEAEYDDDEKDERDSLNSFILERRLSRRRRQEKRQRRRIKAGQDQKRSESLQENSKCLMSDEREKPMINSQGLPGRGQRRDSVTRSLWGPSNSLNSCVRKSSQVVENQKNSSNSSETDSSISSSFCESSLSDEIPASLSPTPMSLKITRQDAVSLTSSCVSIASTNDSRHVRSYLSSSDITSERSRESLRTRSPIGQEAKTSPTKSPDKHAAKITSERSAHKWKQAGFSDVFLISLQPKEYQHDIRVTGGILENATSSRSLVTWVSPDLKSRINIGQEVLEWNGEIMRGQTYDCVKSVTSRVCTQAVLLVNLVPETKDKQSVQEISPIIKSDYPPSRSPELLAKGGKRRILPRIPIEVKKGNSRVKGEIQIKLFYQASRSALSFTVLRARNIACASQSSVPNPFVVITLVPGKSSRDSLETELQTSNSNPEWEQTFLLDGISLSELAKKALQLSVWSHEDGCDVFIGEVLLDLSQSQLDNQAQWYNLEEHDENSTPLPHRRGSHSASLSASWTSGSSALISPTVSPEVPSHRHYRHSPSSAGSNSVSPVPFGTSQVGSREFHINNVSQPDSFTTKVRKKMRDTVSKMSTLSLTEKKENAGSDDSSHNSEILRRLSDKSDRSITTSKSPKLQKAGVQLSHHSKDLLAPPQPLSRTNSSSSFFLSDDEESQGRYSISPLTPDRPPPEGDDITSILGPGQIPPKPSAETSVCGDIKLGFMVSKGQLEVDIICAAGLHRTGNVNPPDTYVKTYLVEGKKVIQRKKTLVVKGSFDPVYRKKIKYSACNVHGRTMKINIWERAGSFEKKACRGEVLVRLDGLDLSKHTMAWYKLFQINSTDYGSDEFLNSW